ncbi:MAG: glycosyltransferase family 2 protein [Lachnospiraceae bacterium]|nr:glycosyltransferase family 2 protein [Lachnospiraceae bacterium]
MQYNIDVVRLREDTLTVAGWAVGESIEDDVKFEVKDSSGEVIPADIVMMNRFDITREIFHSNSDKMFGFDIRFKVSDDRVYYLCMSCKGKEIKEKLSIKKIKKQGGKKSILDKSLQYFKSYGLKSFVTKVGTKLKERKLPYDEWRLRVILDEEALKAQRNHKFDISPKFSIVVPLYRTDEVFLNEMIASVQAQTYENWELCLADGSGSGYTLEKAVEQFVKDDRIKYKQLDDNFGIAGNTNAALDMAAGDYVVLLDHDDLLSPDALYECVAAVNKNIDCDIIYSDEDKIDQTGKHYSEPHFKPDFNIDLLRNVNYICHLFVVKRDIVNSIGGFKSEYDGAQDYDFIFRCIENSKIIVHIPKVLYHWRISGTSTAMDPESKLYAFKAGARAIEDHCTRMGLKVHVYEGMMPGYYRTVFELNDRPPVSVIIPNKDHIQDLDKCLRSLFEVSSYENIEVIVVENNSTEESTFKYYEDIVKKYDKVKVVFWEGQGFNFSAINNFGASKASGEYLLLLNNDTEIINSDCIDELLGYGQREDAGIVGARLLYEDNTLQHAGVVIGFGGIAGHAFVGLHKDEKCYFLRSMCAQDLSAVTAACMLVKKSVFDEVGGLNEELAVAFNDIDFCLKVREAGKLVIYNPYAQLYHYESKSRGLEDSPEKIARFNKEVGTFKERWQDILKAGDPFYNPNLTLRDTNFALKDLDKE